MTENSFAEDPLTYRRDYKDTLFRLIFNDKANLLSLYNAMNGSDYQNPDDLEIVTLENAIYMDMKNDVAFLFCEELHLYEHQSTQNPNMPLRYLFYIAREYEKLLDWKLESRKTLYSSRLIKLPPPRFVVFYNGNDEEPESRLLRLSDAYTKQEDTPNLELLVQVLNVNYGMNRDILKRCRMLSDYAKYVDRVRKYAIILPIKQAVERAINECIAEGILTELLTRYRREVIQMSIFEFNAEKEWKLIRADEREIGYEEGLREGHEAGVLEGHESGLLEGRKSGIAEGEKRFAVLSEKLLTEGQTEKLLKATQDIEYRQKLYEEYQI